MSRKKKHEEHANHERWLISYADFITLLFAFFVVLFASSQVDRSKSKKMALAIESAFQNFSIFKEMSGNDMSSTTGGGSAGNSSKTNVYLAEPEEGKPLSAAPEVEQQLEGAKLPKGDPAYDQKSGFPTSEQQAMIRAQRQLLKMIDSNDMKGNINVFSDKRGMVISINQAVLFDGGTEKLTSDSEQVIRGIARVLVDMPNQVRVEGHTDNSAPSGNYQSNWELSSARSSSIVRLFAQKYRMNPARFIAVGYGEYRPIANNDTAEGKLKNNRVDIVILSDESSTQEAAMYGPDGQPIEVSSEIKAPNKENENNSTPSLPIPHGQ